MIIHRAAPIPDSVFGPDTIGLGPLNLRWFTAGGKRYWIMAEGWGPGRESYEVYDDQGNTYGSWYSFNNIRDNEDFFVQNA